MDFLNESVLPQSSHHMVLLKYLLGLTFLILLPYLSLLIGSTVFSLFYKRKYESTGNKYFIKYSKQLIDGITYNKSLSFGLGIIPMLSSLICFAQLLSDSGADVPLYLGLSLLLLLISLVFVYTYKYSFHLKDILTKVDTGDDNDASLYKNKISTLFSKTGIYGFTFLLISTYLLSGAIHLSIDTSIWQKSNYFFSVYFSLGTLFYFLNIVSLGLLFASIFSLFSYFRMNGEILEKDEKYLEFVKTNALKSGILFSIIQPVILVLYTIVLPNSALSTGVIGFTVLLLFLVLLVSNLLYTMLKESYTRLSNSVLMVFMAALTVFVIKDQLAFGTSSKEQFNILSSKYINYEEELAKLSGKEINPISGEEIFNGRCIACHKYDQRLVGPPYNDVLPKYKDDIDKLTNFVFNPVKINPEYPPMPNQGLKKNEAHAVAEYLLSNFKDSSK